MGLTRRTKPERVAFRGAPLQTVLSAIFASAPGAGVLPWREVPGSIPPGTLSARSPPLPAVRAGACAVRGAGSEDGVGPLRESLDPKDRGRFPGSERHPR